MKVIAYIQDMLKSFGISMNVRNATISLLNQNGIEKQNVDDVMEIEDLLKGLETRRTILKDYTDSVLIKLITKIMELESRIEKLEEVDLSTQPTRRMNEGWEKSR